MIRHRVAALCACVALTLSACGQQQPAGAGGEMPAPSDYATSGDGAPTDDASEPLEEVNPALLAAPNTMFTAIEPSEVGVFAAPTVMQAIEPLIGPQAFEGDAAVSVSVRTEGDIQIADVVRENIPDDSVAAGHVRVEFRQEPEGWFPTNAYRRSMCRRGPNANQWTAELCP